MPRVDSVCTGTLRSDEVGIAWRYAGELEVVISNCCSAILRSVFLEEGRSDATNLRLCQYGLGPSNP
jgi:hypothetical protein